MTPLAGTDLLSAAQRTTLFGNIELIVELNRRFLQQLSPEMGSSVGLRFAQFARTCTCLSLCLSCLSCLFLPRAHPLLSLPSRELPLDSRGWMHCVLAAFFKTYSEYLANYNKAVALLEQLAENPEFQAFSASCSKDPRCKGLDLASFLIMPVSPSDPLSLSLQLLAVVFASDSIGRLLFWMRPCACGCRSSASRATSYSRSSS